MGESYFNLKHKLEQLGYNNLLPVEAVPLVECIIADLLQTTRSLQHYMELSKEALQQRDSLVLEAEPYKCDNIKLIQQNNQLHQEMIQVKEEMLKASKDSKRKIKSLAEEIIKKDNFISKQQHELRDLSLRGLCAGTQSSRNKSKRNDGDKSNPNCICYEQKTQTDNNEIEYNNKISSLLETNEAYKDEILLLKSQVEHRDHEIVRLNILLEGGRPLQRDFSCNSASDIRIQDLMSQIHELESANELLKKQMDNGLEKQHEAMLRALRLADKNKNLQDELQKVDALALKVEEDCNKKLAELTNEIKFLQARLNSSNIKKSQSNFDSTSNLDLVTNIKLHQDLDASMKEKKQLQAEVKELFELNKNLQEKLLTISETNKEYYDPSNKKESENFKEGINLTKDELQTLLRSERKMYEKYVEQIQNKLTETTSLIMSKCKDKEKSSQDTAQRNAFVSDLHVKLCEGEQKILMLKKENDDLKLKLTNVEDGNKRNYKDIISQLNDENVELSKENIALSQQLHQYKNFGSVNESGDHQKIVVERLKNEIECLTSDTHLLKKDKNEYNMRYKEAMDLVERYKRDLALKQNEIEQLQEENNSYKMTHRTGRASAEHLREECHFLREQIKKMQSDVIKEKTLSSQIKNIQIETERSSTEIQNELLNYQRQYSITKDTVEALEKKCKELHSEIQSLNADKGNLIDSIKKVDQERDKLVIELDHKTEATGVLEQKIKSQTYEISRLENDISELKRKLNLNKVSEHKIIDYESQIKFLNGEISRLNQHYDNAVIENKQLQNSLADANGTIKVSKIEYDKSRREVHELRQQLQHYVAEIRRIEEMLSHKEAERSDMLEHFASLSVEANILENTNQSLESESASKSLQLQSYVIRIQELESKLLDKEGIIESQSARIADMMFKITSLENEIKLVTEEKIILEQNVSRLKQMYNNMHSEQNIDDHASSDIKLYENKIKSLTNSKTRLEVDNAELKDNLKSTEKLLSNARKEVIDLKLALQDATSETKSLHDRIGKYNRRETEVHERTLTHEEYNLPLTLEETIEGVINEDDEDSSSCHEARHHGRGRYSNHRHGSTL